MPGAQGPIAWYKARYQYCPCEADDHWLALHGSSTRATLDQVFMTDLHLHAHGTMPLTKWYCVGSICSIGCKRVFGDHEGLETTSLKSIRIQTMVSLLPVAYQTKKLWRAA